MSKFGMRARKRFVIKAFSFLLKLHRILGEAVCSSYKQFPCVMWIFWNILSEFKQHYQGSSAFIWELEACSPFTKKAWYLTNIDVRTKQLFSNMCRSLDCAILGVKNWWLVFGIIVISKRRPYKGVLHLSYGNSNIVKEETWAITCQTCSQWGGNKLQWLSS